MTRVAFLALALCVVARPGSAQDEEALARGQKYLEKVGKVWSEKTPVERLLGIYMGRAWVGHVRISVKAAPPGDAAAFEMTVKGEMKAGDRAQKMDGRALLTASLGVVSAEGREIEDDKPNTKTITISAGRWKLVKTKGEESKETSGDVKPGMTWEGSFLPLWAAPDDGDCMVLNLEGDKQEVRFKKLAEKQKRTIGGKGGEYPVLQMSKPDEEADRWFLDDAGRGIELAAGANPVRMRVIADTDMGKDLAEALELKPAEQAFVDLFTAIKRGDKKVVDEAFDFQKLTESMVPGYDGMTEEQKKATVEATKQQVLDNLLSEEMRERLPEEKILREVLAAQLKSEEKKDGVVHVRIEGRETWKFAQVAAGERKGKWVVIGMEQ